MRLLEKQGHTAGAHLPINALTAHAMKGDNVLVVEDATATFYEEHHRAALAALARVFTQVWDTEQVMSVLKDTSAT